MKRTSIAAALMLLAAVYATAQAQPNGETPAPGELYPSLPAVAGKTRSEVLAELAQAARDGELTQSGELGQVPHLLASAGPGKTRAEVEAELAEAKREGDIMVGDSGLTQRDLFPQRYPKFDARQASSGSQTLAQHGAAIPATR